MAQSLKKIVALLSAARKNPKNLRKSDGKVEKPDNEVVKPDDQIKNDDRDLEALIKAGWNVNVQDKDGLTLLMESASKGDIEACRLLLKHGAKADIKDKDGKMAIDYTCTKLEKSDDKLKADIIGLLKSFDVKPSQ